MESSWLAEEQDISTLCPRNRVHFAEQTQIRMIEPLFGHDLWFDQQTILAHAQAESSWKLVHDRTAQQYLDAYEQAYGSVLEGKTISSDLQQHLVMGVRRGHRVLERHSMVLYQRRLERQTSIRTILQMHRKLSISSSLPGQENVTSSTMHNAEEELRACCDQMSETSREWARVLARIDEDAVSSLEWFHTEHPNPMTTTATTTNTVTTTIPAVKTASAKSPFHSPRQRLRRERQPTATVRIKRRRSAGSGIFLLPRRLLSLTFSKRCEKQVTN
jgi:hypothetical protein